MTFTIKVKEEITKNEVDKIASIVELSSFLRYSANITKNKISLTLENASVARRIYKDIKNNFGINIKIIIRIQKRFRVKRIYILEVEERVEEVLETLNLYKHGRKTLPEEYFLETREDKISYLRGAFLASGTINNPATSGYHLEFNAPTQKEAEVVKSLLKEFQIESKILKRKTHYMIYVKSSEMISDVLRMFDASSSFFEFEDVRIYRDHKNMVNRLNNCEIANQEKILKSGMKQIEDIQYLKDNDLLPLLDESVREAVRYREMYPETSLAELAEIISSETGHKIGKSGVNHYFIKVKKMVERHKNKDSK